MLSLPPHRKKCLDMVLSFMFVYRFATVLWLERIPHIIDPSRVWRGFTVLYRATRRNVVNQNTSIVTVRIAESAFCLSHRVLHFRLVVHTTPQHATHGSFTKDTLEHRPGAPPRLEHPVVTRATRVAVPRRSQVRIQRVRAAPVWFYRHDDHSPLNHVYPPSKLKKFM